MPPCLTQTPLPKSAAETTKCLRARDVPLSPLLSFAERVLLDTSIFFPRKEEWLLEWLVQRLGERGAETTNARCNPAFWRMLLKLLRASSQTSTAAILKKHGFLQVIGKTLSEGKRLPAALVDGNGECVVDGDGEFYTPRETLSAESSSGTEAGLPTVGDKINVSALELLGSVYEVLSYLQEQPAGGRGEGFVIAALRGTPEFGAQILGSYFEACLVLLKGGKTVPEEWTRSILSVWKSCIWGNPNTKKLSNLFSSVCLAPTNDLLLFWPPQLTLQPYLEELLLEFIFTSEIIFPNTPGKPLKASPEKLKAMMKPLGSQHEGRIQLFKLAIKPQMRRSKPDVETIEALMEAIMPFNDTKASPEVYTELLGLFAENNIKMSSGNLAQIIDETSGLSNGKDGDVKWKLIDLALKLDFDIFIGADNHSRGSSLIFAIGHAGLGTDGGQILGTLEVLVDSYARARNLDGFIEIWVEQLRLGSAFWRNDAVAKMIGDRLEKNLSGSQVERLFKQACAATDSELNWVLVDALLRGVRLEETENRIKKYLPKIVKSVEAHASGWHRWRALLRVVQIDGTAVDQEVLKRVQPGTDDPLQTLFFKGLQVALSGPGNVHSADDSLDIAVPITEGGRWDGSIQAINKDTLYLALSTGFVNGWMEQIERIGNARAKKKFIDHLLDMALRSQGDEDSLITARGLWWGMLDNEEFYEFSTLKDAVLAALIRRLRPFSDKLCNNQTLKELGKERQECRGEVLEQYCFVVDSIAHYPPEAIKRSTREKILDTMVMIISRPKLEYSKLFIELDSKIFSVMEKLWALGNASSFLATDAACLFEWTTRQGGNIVRKILRHTFSTRGQERSNEFLSEVVKAVEEASLSVVENFERSIVIIEEFWKAGEADAVRSLKGNLMIHMKGGMTWPESSGSDAPINLNIVRVWRRCWVLDRDAPEGCPTAWWFARHVLDPTFKRGISGFICDDNQTGEKEIPEILMEATLLFCAASENAEQVIETTALIIGLLGSRYTETMGCRNQLVAAFGEMTGRLKADAFEKCLVAVVDGYLMDVMEDVSTGPRYREVLKTVVESIKKPDDEETGKRMTACVSTILSKLARHLHKMPTPEDFLTVITCMDTILRGKPWTVLQFNIDESLTAITISSTPSGPNFTTNEPDVIFLALCDLVRTLLTLYRRRIRGGRYHLVIATMQSLLNCTIKRKLANQRKKSDRIVHPPWLMSTPLPPPLTTASISSGFNRLLGTFCEPSVASVRSRHNASPLDSEREKEKREVVGCVGGLLGAVVKAALMGGFESDVGPGVGKIFEVLGSEGVKVFARGLDKEGRAMLRGMWEEFRKVEGSAEKW